MLKQELSVIKCPTLLSNWSTDIDR